MKVQENFMKIYELSWKFRNHELSWTFMNFHEQLFKKSWSHETLQLQGDCAAMEHRCDSNLEKSWNLNCSSFYDALLLRWVCSWALLTEGVDGVTTLRSTKPWQYKAEDKWPSQCKLWSASLSHEIKTFTIMKLWNHELSWTLMNFHELSWSFQELSWTFMNFHELSRSRETLRLQGNCAAMKHRRDASLVKSWNLNCCVSTMRCCGGEFGHGFFLLTQGVARVTTFRSVKPWPRKTERQIWTWIRCLKAKLYFDEVW